jgi:hypothetical protein
MRDAIFAAGIADDEVLQRERMMSATTVPP